MSDYKLKVKIGDHEFEADGPVEAVKSQFDVFKELIATLAPSKPNTTNSIAESEIIAPPTAQSALDVDRIFQMNGRVVSLTVPPNSETDAVLLIMYGQRHFRKNENPTGSEILDGLAMSGYRATRIDRILTNLSTEGAVIITGAHRGKRYRLTNAGVTRTEGIVKDALRKLP
jgi:hypothetical protein